MITPTGIAEDLARTAGGGVVRGASTAVVTGSDPLAPSPHRLADASAAALAAFGREVAALDEDRGAPAQEVTVTASDGLDQLRAPFLADVNGVAPHALTDDPTLLGLNDFYATRDGWIFLLSTYPHLRAAVCGVLGCPPDHDAVAAAAGRWDALALQEAVVAAGGVAVAVHTEQQWRAHPVGQHLATRPVVEVERIGDAPPRPLPAPREVPGWAPLAGLRVLDNTHVIAGPAGARLLAAFGADVLHTSRPDRPDPLGMLALTGGGKRNAYADLGDPAGRAAFDARAGEADVVVSSYRNLAARGLGPTQLAEAHPGIVAAEVHCWGADGPWGTRGGFDQLATAATGFALAEGEARGLPAGAPALPPTHLVNDYLAADLVAVGIVAAVRRRAVEGGSWRVRVNLARVCTWVRELGTFAVDDVRSVPMPAPSVERYTVHGPLGSLTEPVLPLSFSTHRTPLPGAPALLGTSPLTFAS